MPAIWMFIMYTKTKEVMTVGYTINIKIRNYASFLMKDEKMIKIMYLSIMQIICKNEDAKKNKDRCAFLVRFSHQTQHKS